ncbi:MULTISPECIES: F0F1 ATP synthase subunit delta [unclassified Undibacterium]|uniref:F0F1 ATP synthase subunit delta n=1 Tax=unclassified Undibacterium TaxID=2630295 RepID=UPI002AC9AE3A|nr:MULTISPECIES: F0F1 ATP synthase subunit delta [unclassified Undibacterium]MEB0137855.1 F0F1 ATP synthase subunit delta [Undibacterium sp. CCC2.1]MEB0170954.1 F0F1 ATP synthase subunit delta [Undibacterium sp. CCC1.1]MEB0174999.1 F0F1 ATP synthase subunit delta [Undibacterium sp. CCC3.4]MEB0215795.1 F0F1 ATP synthase subunit delta [Undibacterium sp. 5I2]WPX44805.1 F0F1 ATP synthase subunit delta [Undibacterium sp. CCC3.4]
MAELATIARPYAEALFRVAQTGDLSAWSDLVAELAYVGAHPDVQALAHNPKISAAVKAEIVLSALKSPVTAEAKNFIATLADYERLTVLPEIAFQFHALKNAYDGAADAEVTSAFDLSAAQLSELAATLEHKFGRKLRPTVKVDPTLIGGVRIVVGDQVLDTSVRAKLQKMHVALTA